MSETTSEKLDIKKILRYPKGSTFLSVGKLFPQTWDYVIVTILKREEGIIIVEFREVAGKLREIMEADRNES